MPFTRQAERKPDQATSLSVDAPENITILLPMVSYLPIAWRWIGVLAGHIHTPVGHTQHLWGSILLRDPMLVSLAPQGSQ